MMWEFYGLHWCVDFLGTCLYVVFFLLLKIDQVLESGSSHEKTCLMPNIKKTKRLNRAGLNSWLFINLDKALFTNKNWAFFLFLHKNMLLVPFRSVSVGHF